MEDSLIAQVIYAMTSTEFVSLIIEVSLRLAVVFDADTSLDPLAKFDAHSQPVLLSAIAVSVLEARRM